MREMGEGDRRDLFRFQTIMREMGEGDRRERFISFSNLMVCKKRGGG